MKIDQTNVLVLYRVVRVLPVGRGNPPVLEVVNPIDDRNLVLHVVAERGRGQVNAIALLREIVVTPTSDSVTDPLTIAREVLLNARHHITLGTVLHLITPNHIR